jgi:hypothetical protein
MPEDEKVLAYPAIIQPVFWVIKGKKALLRAALILFVPYWIDSIHELLRRVA